MKKYFMIFAAAMTVFAACQEEMTPEINTNVDEIIDYPIDITFVASNEVGTKTVINGEQITWESDDEIKVLWSNTGSNKAIASPYNENSCAKFTTKVEEADAYYAVHPYAATSSYVDGNIVVKVPSVQGGLFENANIAVAKATEEMAFNFRHLVGMIEFTTDTPGKVTISGAEGDILTGTVTVTGFDANGYPQYSEDKVTGVSSVIEIDVKASGTYYAAFLPSATLKCLSVKVEGKEATEYALSPNQLQMARGKIIELGNVDSKFGKNLFVSASADGNGDGKTWETALTFDQMANMLSANRNGALSDDIPSDETYKETHKTVHASEIHGKTFHIAAGEYQTANYIRMKFAQNTAAVKVTLKGGYDANSKGTDLSKRNVATYVTKVKGAKGATGGSGTKRIFLINNNVDLTLDGLSLTDGIGDGTYGGGAVFMDAASSTLNCLNCTIADNTSPVNSGAIYVTAGTLAFTNTTFSKNTGTGGSSYGGAINVKNASLTCTGCTFSENSSYNNGGAVWLNAMSKAEFTNCDFISNESTANLAGAICLSGANPLNITGGTFRANKAANGGCFYNNAASTVNITGSKFIDNAATNGVGGVFYCNEASGPVFNIENAEFTGNTATKEGGALCCKAGKWNITGTTFDGNIAGNHGGALHSTGSSAVFVIDGSIIKNNSVTGSAAAGAIYSNATTTGNTVSNTKFESNSTLTHGGALYWSGSGSLALDKCHFEGNYAANSQGAVIKKTAGTLYCNASSFTSNIAKGERTGGVMRIEGGNTFISNCCFYGNTATQAHTDLVLCGGTTTVLNSTLFESDKTMACIRVYNAAAVANLYNNVLLNPNTASNEGTVRVGYWKNPGSVTSSGYNYTTEWKPLVDPGVNGSITMADTDKVVAYTDVSGNFTSASTTDGRGYYTWTKPTDVAGTTTADVTAFLNGITGGSDFATWLGTVDGLTKDIAGNSRPATGWYPGCYQGN